MLASRRGRVVATPNAARRDLWAPRRVGRGGGEASRGRSGRRGSHAGGWTVVKAIRGSGGARHTTDTGSTNCFVTRKDRKRGSARTNGIFSGACRWMGHGRKFR